MGSYLIIWLHTLLSLSKWHSKSEVYKDQELKQSEPKSSPQNMAIDIIGLERPSPSSNPDTVSWFQNSMSNYNIISFTSRPTGTRLYALFYCTLVDRASDSMMAPT